MAQGGTDGFYSPSLLPEADAAGGRVRRSRPWRALTEAASDCSEIVRTSVDTQGWADFATLVSRLRWSDRGLEGRHNQRLSRNAGSWSGGPVTPGLCVCRAGSGITVPRKTDDRQRDEPGGNVPADRHEAVGRNGEHESVLKAGCFEVSKPFCRISGLNEPAGPLSPTAQTIAAPGLVATAPTPSVLLGLGLATTFHAAPFQFRVRVCRADVPAGVSAPTAPTSLAALEVVTPPTTEDHNTEIHKTKKKKK